MKNNSSEKLLAQYVQGSPSESAAASIEIHSRYLNRLIALAQNRLLGILKSKVDADDIAQEVFVAFFAMADRDEIKWKERGDLWRLLAGIAINKVKQQFERYSTLKRDLRTESQLPVNVEVGERDVTELAELVDHVLSSEKPLVARVLNFRLAGFSFEEIAELASVYLAILRLRLSSNRLTIKTLIFCGCLAKVVLQRCIWPSRFRLANCLRSNRLKRSGLPTNKRGSHFIVKPSF